MNMSTQSTTSPRSRRLTGAYWTVTILFSVFMVVSAIGELTQATAVVTSLDTLGVPLYYLNLLGVLKLLGAVVILVPGYPTLKEWAYAGFVFDFVGALYGLLAVQAPLITDWIAAPLALLLCLASYGLYRITRRMQR